MAYYKISKTTYRDIDERFLDSIWTMNLSFVDEECDFFCLECSRMHNCIAYSEIKEEWESFYT